LYLWSTKDLKNESKIVEAYDMLKKQGIILEDPVHVGDAVFASALPPRKAAPLSAEQTSKLRTLLQSKNPDDLQMANKIIKGMVQEDERKMDVLTKRSTELTMVNNNAKLLGEMLDHYHKTSCGSEEKQLLHELFQSCEKMQPKLFRLAADTEEDDESSLGKILQASDDISRVIERYKMVIVQGKPDILRTVRPSSLSEQLLDLEVVGSSPPYTVRDISLLDDDLLSLVLGSSEPISEPIITSEEPKPVKPAAAAEPVVEKEQQQPSVDDLLNDSPTMRLPAATLPVTNKPAIMSPVSSSKIDHEKASRQRGLEELDLLGESLLKKHLPEKSPHFVVKKEEKLSLSTLQQKQKEKDLTSAGSPLSSLEQDTFESSVVATGSTVVEAVPSIVATVKPPQQQTEVSNGVKNDHHSPKVEEVRLADLNVPLSCIKPGSIPPVTLQESEDGLSIVLHIGKESPRDHVTAIVVTVINKLPEAISNYEMKAVVPKGCKVKLQSPTTTALPAHNPFVPPSAITQVMLIANPHKKEVSFKYILSYTQDGEPQTEMGQVDKLPI
jgi:ADP-ribosylation factor-binding protein GGA